MLFVNWLSSRFFSSFSFCYKQCEICILYGAGSPTFPVVLSFSLMVGTGALVDDTVVCAFINF